MPFVFNRYSGLLLIFFVHGLVYAFLLLRRGIKTNTASDKWLALFLILCILFICPWMLGFAGWYDGINCPSCRNIMFYMPMQHSLLMGPVIYFYLKSLFNPSFKFSERDSLHFIPGVAYLLWCVIVFITDQLVLKKYYLMNGITDPDLDDWYIGAGLISLLAYLALCFNLHKKYRQYIVHQISFADAVTFRWVGNFLVSLFIFFFLSLFFHVLSLSGFELDYTGNWWYYLFFGLIFYYIAINGYANSIESRSLFGLNLLSYETPLLLDAPPQAVPVAEAVLFQEVEPAAKTITDLDQWKEKVMKAVVDEKMYTNPELTLVQLAKHLQTSTTVLSKIINTGFALNFNDFINFYRVQDVKQKLENGSAAQVTIMSLAYDAGFNSKATFNRAFKKVTGKNPKDFSGTVE